MDTANSRLGPDDVIVGLDLATREHQAVVALSPAPGKRLTRFRVPHSRKGLAELLRRIHSGGPRASNGPSPLCL